MSKELLNDGKYIFINTPYAEAYIPDDLFDRPNEDPSPSSLAYNTGESIITIGIFYMRFFDSEDNINSQREKVKLRTLAYPNKIETFPTGNTSRETLTINGNTEVYRVLRYYQGDILMSAASQKSANNVEMFTKLVMAGKVPNSLSYDELYFTWKKNFEINDVNAAIPPVLLQAIISKICRNPENTSQEFRKLVGKRKVDLYNYIMLSMNQISAYSSVMTSMAFERFAEKLTTSLIMTKEGTPQEKSPIEQVITM